MPLIKRELEKQESSSPSLQEPSQPPPAYAPAAHGSDGSVALPDITAGFSNLKLADSSTEVPTIDHCIAHLKLLEAFHQLREDVALQDGRYGIKDEFLGEPAASDTDPQRLQQLTQMREKRWAIFVAKAAHRFEKWWRVCVEPNATRMRMANREPVKDRLNGNKTLQFDSTNLPPLGVSQI